MNAESSAFKKLCAFIRDELFVSPSVVTLSFLRKKMTTWMTSEGIDTITDSTKKHLKRKLVAEFEDSLKVCTTSYGTILLILQTMSTSMLAEKIHKLEQRVEKLEANKSACKSSVITRVAAHIRHDIKYQNQLPWPPNPESQNSANVNLPPTVTLFLETLLTGETSPANLS